jgi:hypothetical protein
MIDFIEAFGTKRLAVPSFVEEYTGLARRYSRRRSADNPDQSTLNFSTATASTLADNHLAATDITATNVAPSTGIADSDLMTVARLPYFVMAGGTYART